MIFWIGQMRVVQSTVPFGFEVSVLALDLDGRAKVDQEADIDTCSSQVVDELNLVFDGEFAHGL